MKITSAKPDSTIISVKLDNEVFDRLKKRTEKMNTTTSRYVAELIEQALQPIGKENNTVTSKKNDEALKRFGVRMIIKDCNDNDIAVYPTLKLYSVKERLWRKDAYGIMIQLFYEDEDLGSILPYATLTTSFGEMLGLKNVAYIDTNNCPFANQLLKPGIAQDTGFTMVSGFCEYPLYRFDEDFLRNIGAENYQKYLEKYDEIMTKDIYEQ